MQISKSVQAILLDVLGRGWYAPHELDLQLKLSGFYCSPTAITSRIRDLRKARYGGHSVVKRLRKDSGYYEYKVLSPEEIQKAA